MRVDKKGYLWNLCECVNKTMKQTAERKYESKELLIFNVMAVVICSDQGINRHGRNADPIAMTISTQFSTADGAVLISVHAL